MDQGSNLLMNTSILYRSMQKYYDKRLDAYDIGAGQLLFLICIYENEGISMQALAQMGSFDKGTITKGIAKLEELGYVQSKNSESDRRVRFLYTSEKTKDIIGEIYLLRREWWEKITKGLSVYEIEHFIALQAKLAENARTYAVEEEPRVRIFGLQKLTLLDYPGRLAATIFTGGCNFRCPFCHNKDLVFLPEDMTEMEEQDVYAFLNQRKGILDGVCVSGGEPLLQPNIEDMIREIKALGYDVKLDTNGSQPKKLKQLIEAGLIDYVAMDVKNCKERYGETIGVMDFDLSPIQESVEYLKQQTRIPYEFRTTVVQQFHDEKSMLELAKWLQGGSALYLQGFEDSERVIQAGLQAHRGDVMKQFKELCNQYLPTQLRGL